MQASFPAKGDLMIGSVKIYPLLCAALLTALAVTGCGKPKEQAPTPAEATAAAPKPAPAEATATAPGPAMPALPAWAAEYVGKPLQATFSGVPATCDGNAEIILQRYGGAAPGVQIQGWAWDPKAKSEIERILIVDDRGVVQGAGVSGWARPDVNAARPSITGGKTGWAAETHLTKGPINAYGVVEGGKAVCLLGRLAY